MKQLLLYIALFASVFFWHAHTMHYVNPHLDFDSDIIEFIQTYATNPKKGLQLRRYLLNLFPKNTAPLQFNFGLYSLKTQTKFSLKKLLNIINESAFWTCVNNADLIKNVDCMLQDPENTMSEKKILSITHKLIEKHASYSQWCKEGKQTAIARTIHLLQMYETKPNTKN